jgi:hypothetical protein
MKQNGINLAKPLRNDLQLGPLQVSVCTWSGLQARQTSITESFFGNYIDVQKTAYRAWTGICVDCLLKKQNRNQCSANYKH